MTTKNHNFTCAKGANFTFPAFFPVVQFRNPETFGTFSFPWGDIREENAISFYDEPRKIGNGN